MLTRRAHTHNRMQLIDNLHCRYLETTFVTVDVNCDQMIVATEITGSWIEKQTRQACTCVRWNEISMNRSKATETPHAAHHALLTVGKMDFKNEFKMTYQSMIEGLLATVPVQITYGMLLGKVGPSQLMLSSLMCVTSYGINFWVNMYIFGAWDHAGGCCMIHIFGAFFGAGCTLLASGKGAAQNPDNAPRYNADVLCTVGVILNWMTFPSFNAYYVPARAQQAVVVNTYLSQFASCVAAMVFSSLYSGQFKLDPADVQRSSIAGGVAISSVVSLFAKPYQAMCIGVSRVFPSSMSSNRPAIFPALLAQVGSGTKLTCLYATCASVCSGFAGGAACSTSHHFLRRFLEKHLSITDTVGAISLHAVPSLIAWGTGVYAVSGLSEAEMGKWQGLAYGPQQTRTMPYDLEYGLIFQHNLSGSKTALQQAMMLPITIAIATAAGLLTVRCCPGCS